MWIVEQTFYLLNDCTERSASVAAWLSGSALVSNNEVTLRQARLVLGWGQAGKPPRFVTSHSGQLLPSVEWK